MINLYAGQAALTLLGGTSLLGASSDTTGAFSVAMPSAAVVRAKAQFKTAVVQAPWQSGARTAPRVEAVLAAKALVPARSSSLPDDLKTNFAAWSAIDSLQVLATAAQSTTSETTRRRLDDRFAAGLAELQGFLATAPSDLTDVAFGAVKRTAQSVAVPALPLKTYAKAVAETRDAALDPAGARTYSMTLTKAGRADTVTVDLSSGPLTLDEVASKLNAAIASVPLTDSSNQPILDSAGNPIPRYLARFAVEKGATGWGLTLTAPQTERVGLKEAGAVGAVGIVSGQSLAGASSPLTVSRIDAADSAAPQRASLGTLQASDLRADELTAIGNRIAGKSGATITPATAPMRPVAVASDGAGGFYIAGTTAGDLGAWRTDGGDAMFVTRVDASGATLWQRRIDLGDATTAASLIAGPEGVTIAGTATNGSGTALALATLDADGVVTSQAALPSLGFDKATAVTRASDGSLFMAGRDASGSFVAHVVDGRITARQHFAGLSSIAAVSESGGHLAVLGSANGHATLIGADTATMTEQSSVDLGAGVARALTRDTTTGQLFAGFDSAAGEAVVASLSVDGATLSGSASIGAGTQVDSLGMADGRVVVGGRIAGAGGTGLRDSLVASLDPASLAETGRTRWGVSGASAEPTLVAGWAGASGSLAALGLKTGFQADPAADKLTRSTSLVAGDQFTLQVGTRKLAVTIGADDTMSSLATRVSKLLGTAGKARVVTSAAGQTLQIEAATTDGIALVAGPKGKDALGKLGLEPQRLTAPYIRGEKDPLIQPGGVFSLGMSDALSLKDKASAKLAATVLSEAKEKLQSAYRSLYWDDLKAQIVDGTTGQAMSAYDASRLAAYKDALVRLGG